MIVRRDQRTPRDRRRGFTIVEVMVLMTAVAVMLGMCVVVLQLALRLEIDARGRFDRATVLNQLAERFRADVRGARGVQVEDENANPDPKQPPVLRVESASGRSIEYRATGAGEVARVESEGDQVVHRETFRIPQTGEARMELRDFEGRRFAVLSIDTLTRPDRIDPARTLEVLALVGGNSGSLGSETKGGEDGP